MIKLAITIFACFMSFQSFATPHDLEKEALSKLEELGLKTGEFSSPSFVAMWRLQEVKEHNEVKLLIMRLSNYKSDGITLVSDRKEFDVLAFNESSESVVAFETMFEIPSSIRVVIGHADYETNGVYKIPASQRFYVAELNDKKSVIDALKSIYSEQRYHGFAGYIPYPTVRGPLEFDPTEDFASHGLGNSIKRTWRVEDATFDLRRGNTAEVADIQAYQLDGVADFDGYFSGGDPINLNDRLWVAPWGQSAVLGFVEDYQKILSKVDPSVKSESTDTALGK